MPSKPSNPTEASSPNVPEPLTPPRPQTLSSDEALRDAQETRSQQETPSNDLPSPLEEPVLSVELPNDPEMRQDQREERISPPPTFESEEALVETGAQETLPREALVSQNDRDVTSLVDPSTTQAAITALAQQTINATEEPVPNVPEPCTPPRLETLRSDEALRDAQETLPSDEVSQNREASHPLEEPTLEEPTPTGSDHVETPNERKGPTSPQNTPAQDDVLERERPQLITEEDFLTHDLFEEVTTSLTNKERSFVFHDHLVTFIEPKEVKACQRKEARYETLKKVTGNGTGFHQQVYKMMEKDEEIISLDGAFPFLARKIANHEVKRYRSAKATRFFALEGRPLVGLQLVPRDFIGSK